MCHKHSHETHGAARAINVLDAMCRTGDEVEKMSDDELVAELIKMDDHTIDSKESWVFAEVVDRLYKYKEKATGVKRPDEPPESA